MQAIVLSDNHGQIGPIQRIVESHPDYSLYIHLGDGCGSVERLRELYPHLAFWAVRGNSDYGSELPDEMLQAAAGHHILLTHGHKYSVKSGQGHLIARARERGADIALFGHTHLYCSRFEAGVHLFNPGSVALPRTGKPSYGVLHVRQNGILFSRGDSK